MTPEEIDRNFIIDHYLESAFEGELESDLIKILSAAVAAEHQRTLEQCAKIVCPVCAGKFPQYDSTPQEIIGGHFEHVRLPDKDWKDNVPCESAAILALP